MATTNYQPKLPLQLDDNNNFVNIDDVLTNVKQKMRMLILTNPGEKLMNPDFGVGAYGYLFENESKNTNIVKNYGVVDTVEIVDAKENLKKEIIRQTEKYLSDVSIKSINILVENQVLFITINYSYRNMVSDMLGVSLAG